MTTHHAQGEALQNAYEPHPDPHALTSHDPNNPSSGVDYEPHPTNSKPLNNEQTEIIRKICGLYSGGASEELMEVYAREAVYDDPFSYCDSRYKIAGQWYGIPKLFSSSRTLKTEVVSVKPSEIVFKLQQEYTPRPAPVFSKAVNSLVTLSLDDEGKVRYHKDMWNEKDYSHEGLGKIFKNLNGDHLTKITRPPETL